MHGEGYHSTSTMRLPNFTAIGLGWIAPQDAPNSLFMV